MISRFPRAERLSQGLPQPQALLPPAAPGMRRASRFLIYFKPKHTQQPVLVKLVKATFESCSSTSPRRSPAAVNLRHGAPDTQINVPWCFSPLLPALPCLRVTAGTVTAAALEPGADEPRAAAIALMWWEESEPGHHQGTGRPSPMLCGERLPQQEESYRRIDPCLLSSAPVPLQFHHSFSFLGDWKLFTCFTRTKEQVISSLKRKQAPSRARHDLCNSYAVQAELFHVSKQQQKSQTRNSRSPLGSVLLFQGMFFSHRALWAAEV